MMQLIQALRTESVTAMNQYAWNSLAHIEPVSAVVAEVEATGLVVRLNNKLIALHPLDLPLLRSLLLLGLAPLPQSQMAILIVQKRKS